MRTNFLAVFGIINYLFAFSLQRYIKKMKWCKKSPKKNHIDCFGGMCRRYYNGVVTFYLFTSITCPL